MLKILVMLGFMAAAGALGWYVRGEIEQDHVESTRSSDVGPILERIHTLSSLTTLRVEVADAVVVELRGKTGGISAVLLVHGEATLGVDLSQAKFTAVNEMNRRAILILPQPRVQFVKLDHGRTKLIGLGTDGLWLIVPGGNDADAAIYDLAYRRGEAIVSAAAADPELARQAREQAERIIACTFEPIFWKIEVLWRS